MHRQGVLLRHVVVHHSKDTLLHFTSIRASQNDLFFCCEVHVDSVLALDVLQLRVSHELACVEDCEVRSRCKIFFDLLLRCSLKHLLHEKRVVGTSGDDASLQLEARVPSCVLVDNKDASAHIEEVNCSALVVIEAFSRARNIHLAPMDFLQD